MTRTRSLRWVAASVFAVLLSACGGSAGVDQATDTTAAAASTAGQNRTTGATEAQAKGNPGAPGDVAVFEEAGVPYSVLRQDAAARCGNGACRLLEPVVTAGSAQKAGGVDNCTIEHKSDIHYVPEPVDGKLRRGTTVQASVDCTDFEPSGGSTTGTSSGETSGHATPSP